MTEKYSKQPSAPSYKQYKVSHDYESVSEPDYSPPHHEESEPSPHMSHNYLDASWSTGQTKLTYTHSPIQKVAKQSKKVYDPGYVATTHPQKPMYSACPPIVCAPRYIIQDCYIPREVPVIQPIIKIRRHIIVNVPKHQYQPSTKDVVVDPGCPGQGSRPPGYY